MRAAPVAMALLAAACSGSSPPPPAAWHVVLQGLSATLLCVWGTQPGDVFTVGGSLGNGGPSTMLHYDGHAWATLSPGGTETLWWTHGSSSNDVWAVGEKGRITHWNGSAFSEFTSGTTATLYGVWAAAANDVWAVGGTPGAGTSQPNDVLLHYEGSSWQPSPLPQTLGRTFFKVWGTASDNLYVVGEYGTIWHRTGTTWALEANKPPLATGNLTTVSGCSATEVYAVGGQDVLVSDGTSWQKSPVSASNTFNGVSCASAGAPILVGSAGVKERLVQGQWQDDFRLEPHNDFHGAWADPAGGYWAAGGDFTSSAQAGVSRQGVLAYYGSVPPS
jgi:hypothetical protein